MSGPDPVAGNRNFSPMGEWPARAADAIDHFVALLRDRAVRPVILLVRALVFGAIIAAMGLVAMVLSAITLVRLLDLEAFDGRVWASDTVVGGVFVLLGLVLWLLRTKKGATDRGTLSRRK